MLDSTSLKASAQITRGTGRGVLKELSAALKVRRLRDLKGVGSAIQSDLKLLGVNSVAELAGCEGAELYERLCKLTGSRQDPCVLDTFRCAVAQARNPLLPVEQRNWWWWSRERKESQGKPRTSK